MRRVFMVAVFLVGFVAAGQAAFQIPNLEGGIGYDFEVQKIVTCMSSKVLTIETAIGDIDGRIGYTESRKPIVSLSYDLKNLEKINVKIHYVLQEQITLAAGISVNIDDRKVNLFIHAIMGTVGDR